MVTARTEAELLRKRLLELLEDTAMTTAELRRLLGTTDQPRPVNEAVYRCLLVLEQRGDVTRLRSNGRHVAWRRTTPEGRKGGADD